MYWTAQVLPQDRAQDVSLSSTGGYIAAYLDVSYHRDMLVGPQKGHRIEPRIYPSRCRAQADTSWRRGSRYIRARGPAARWQSLLLSLGGSCGSLAGRSQSASSH
jgi:hypothetical protein